MRHWFFAFTFALFSVHPAGVMSCASEPSGVVSSYGIAQAQECTAQCCLASCCCAVDESPLPTAPDIQFVPPPVRDKLTPADSMPAISNRLFGFKSHASRFTLHSFLWLSGTQVRLALTCNWLN